MWRQASLPAVEDGILPPGKKLRRAKRSEFTGVSFVVTPVRRAGSHGSTSAKMADATFFRPALKRGLKEIPPVRPEKVALAGALAADSSYPSDDVLDRLADFLAQRIRR
jgi:hypothetical protein